MANQLAQNQTRLRYASIHFLLIVFVFFIVIINFSLTFKPFLPFWKIKFRKIMQDLTPKSVKWTKKNHILYSFRSGMIVPLLLFGLLFVYVVLVIIVFCFLFFVWLLVCLLFFASTFTVELCTWCSRLVHPSVYQCILILLQLIKIDLHGDDDEVYVEKRRKKSREAYFRLT